MRGPALRADCQERGNIKLASVATDVFGTCGRELSSGRAGPAWLAEKKLGGKVPELEVALEGKVEEYHRFLLQLQLDRG